MFTAYDNTETSMGRIMLFKISSGMTYPVGQAVILMEPKINGDWLVWREGDPSGAVIMMYDLAWLGTWKKAFVLAGPVPPPFQVDIGDRFVVWAELDAGQMDVVAYDLQLNYEIAIISTPSLHESHPSTSGPWVVWQMSDGSANFSIHALNMDTSELRALTGLSPSIYNVRPSIDQGLITYDSNTDGDYEIYVYRIDEMDTFPVTVDPTDQYLNDVYGSLVAYVDERFGDKDVWVSKINFVAHEPDIEVSDLVFGDVEISTSAEQIATPFNGGSAPLVISSVSTGGSPDLTIASPLPGSLPITLQSGESLDIQLVFTPISEGLSTNVVSIESDDPDEPIAVFEVQGTGVPGVPPPAEQIEEILKGFDEAVDLGTLTGDGPNSKSADGRRGALRNMLEQAGIAITNNDLDSACSQLGDVVDRMDGEFPPPDFIAGDYIDPLMAEVVQLRATLGCQ